MSGQDSSARFTPPGFGTVTPRLFAADCARLVQFLRKVFDATGEYRESSPSQIRIGDSLIMVSDTRVRSRSVSTFYVYVADVDATYRRALDAGARSFEAPAVMPYGDRRCIVQDPWENIWQIATYLGNETHV